MPSPPQPQLVGTPAPPPPGVALPHLQQHHHHHHEKHLVFFIPGVPGPAAYYHPFLSSLHAALRDGPAAKRARFEVLAAGLSAGTDADASPSPSLPSMAGAIDHVESVLLARVAAAAAPGRDESAAPGVVLVGHGAGAYIALELLRRWRGDGARGRPRRVVVEGAVCLFPSVPGRTAGRGVLSRAALTVLASSALLVQHAVRLFVLLVPAAAVETVLRTTGALSPNAVKVTSEMVRSRWGVYKALTLWRNQAGDQQTGRWDEAIYQTNCAVASPPAYMLFGQHVDEPEVGRGLPAQLNRVAGIHTSALPDCFSVDDGESETVAQLVSEYVAEIVERADSPNSELGSDGLEKHSGATLPGLSAFEAPVK